MSESRLGGAGTPCLMMTRAWETGLLVMVGGFLGEHRSYVTVVRYKLRRTYLVWMIQQQGETRSGTTTEVVVLNRGERSISRSFICAMALTLSALPGNCGHFLDGYVGGSHPQCERFQWSAGNPGCASALCCPGGSCPESRISTSSRSIYA